MFEIKCILGSLLEEPKLFFLTHEDEIRTAIESENYKNNKLRHLVFLLYLKKRRDVFDVVLNEFGASHAKRAVFLAKLWIPIEKENIDNGISFLKVAITKAKNLITEASSKEEKELKKFICPHCNAEFSEISLASNRLSVDGLIFSFCTAVSINLFADGFQQVACPHCEGGLDKEKLSKGEYDASKAWCFVASEVFSADSQEVKILKEIRDDWLLNIIGGKTFVRMYYKFGPFIAKIIALSCFLEAITRKILNFIISVWLAKSDKIS
jgi:uncharacterized protein (UPF0212 family)